MCTRHRFTGKVCAQGQETLCLVGPAVDDEREVLQVGAPGAEKRRRDSGQQISAAEEGGTEQVSRGSVHGFVLLPEHNAWHTLLATSLTRIDTHLNVRVLI